MRFAYHLWGPQTRAFADKVPGPKACFYEPNESPRIDTHEELGVRLEPGQKIPSWDKLCGIQYNNNETTKPSNIKYLIFYGDVRTIRDDDRIPVVCDIMDESFWYYWKALKRPGGLFTFSVNTSLCDIVIFESIIRNLAAEARCIPYGRLS